MAFVGCRSRWLPLTLPQYFFFLHLPPPPTHTMAARCLRRRPPRLWNKLSTCEKGMAQVPTTDFTCGNDFVWSKIFLLCFSYLVVKLHLRLVILFCRPNFISFLVFSLQVTLCCYFRYNLIDPSLKLLLAWILPRSSVTYYDSS